MRPGTEPTTDLERELMEALEAEKKKNVELERKLTALRQNGPVLRVGF